MKPQNTADTVALILAGVVALVVLAAAGAMLYLTITNPERDITTVFDAIGRIIGVLVGVLAGYIAGRRINGNH